MVSIVNDGFVRFVFRPFGGHNLLVRNVAFYAFWHLFGLHAAPCFWAMLLTHLLNVWLLFRVLERLTGSALLACFGATLWGTSPLAAGVLAWYAVFGQALVATILLVVLGHLVALSRSGAAVPAPTAWLYGLLLLGSVTFGVGIGVALVGRTCGVAVRSAARVGASDHRDDLRLPCRRRERRGDARSHAVPRRGRARHLADHDHLSHRAVRQRILRSGTNPTA
jgi:hypothetical protein